MKNNPFKYFVFLMLSLLMVATTGCTEDDISMPAGQLPDETPMNSVGGQLCSGKTFSNKITVSMYEGDGTPIDYYKEAARFNVVSGIEDMGVARIEHTWKNC